MVLQILNQKRRAVNPVISRREATSRQWTKCCVKETSFGFIDLPVLILVLGHLAMSRQVLLNVDVYGDFTCNFGTGGLRVCDVFSTNRYPVCVYKDIQFC